MFFFCLLDPKKDNDRVTPPHHPRVTRRECENAGILQSGTGGDMGDFDGTGCVGLDGEIDIGSGWEG